MTTLTDRLQDMQAVVTGHPTRPGPSPGGWQAWSEHERRAWRLWFDRATRGGGELWDAAAGRPALRGIHLRGHDLSGARLVGADLSRADLREADLSRADLSGADLFAASLDGAILSRASLRDAVMTSTRLSGADLSGADLSGAAIHLCDLTGVDFRDARLFGTRITEPTWWINLPSATLGGDILFQRAIPEHAIQDVLGLPPLLRRQIADVQHLRDVYRKSYGMSRRMIWAWGLCCGFGQSLGRLALTAVAIMLAFVLLYMLTDFSLTRAAPGGGDVVRYVAHPSFGQSIYFAVTTFTAPGTSGMFPVGQLGKVLLAVQGVVCFLLLGGLLSIFANKMARLS